MSLLPTKEELSLLSSQVQEALNLYGVKATRFKADEVSQYDDAIETGDHDTVMVLLQENPQRKLLDTLGWWVKDESPVLVYMAVEVNGVPTEPSRNDVLVLPDRTAYRVQEMNRNLLHGVWYVLKCNAYVRDQRSVETEKVGTQSVFLKQPRKEVL